MFKAESDLTEKEGVAIWAPTRGLGYQLAGALGRLGVRMTALVDDAQHSARYKFLSMHTHQVTQDGEYKVDPHNPLETLVFAADPHLSSPPQASSLESLVAELLRVQKVQEKLGKNIEKFKTLWILPEMPEVLSFIQLRPQDTVIWTPSVYTFRDDFLFDRLIAALKENPGTLDTRKTCPIRFPFVYAGDTAGVAVSVVQSSKFWGRQIHISTPFDNPNEFLTEFLTAFNELNTASWLERLSSRLESKNWFDFIDQNAPSQSQFLQNLSAKGLSPENCWNLFPTAITPLRRSFQTLKRSLEKFKDTELIFPPGQTP
jgi:hypothetical protein